LLLLLFARLLLSNYKSTTTTTIRTTKAIAKGQKLTDSNKTVKSNANAKNAL